MGYLSPIKALVVKNRTPGASADATKDVTEGGRYRRKPGVQVAPRVMYRSCSLPGAVAHVRRTIWRKIARLLGAEARAQGLLGDLVHVTDLVHLPGFGAVSGANEGASICAK